METIEELQFAKLYYRRIEFLNDMDIGELLDMLPDDKIKEFKKLIIEEIIEGSYDKGVNPEIV